MLMPTPVPGPCDDPYTHPYERPRLPDGASWGHAPAHHAEDYVYPGRAVSTRYLSHRETDIAPALRPGRNVTVTKMLW